MQQLTSGVSVWQRRSLLLKLSEQTQLLEELAEISVDRLGAVTSAADGRCQQVVCCVCLPCSAVFKEKSCSLEPSVCYYLSTVCTILTRRLKGVCSVWPCLLFTFPHSSPWPRRAPPADDSVVRVQRVCRTFPHHTGQSVQTHEPALHSSAAGESPTQCRHRLDHGYSLSPNEAEVTLNTTSFWFTTQSCFYVSTESLICFANQFWIFPCVKRRRIKCGWKTEYLTQRD